MDVGIVVAERVVERRRGGLDDLGRQLRCSEDLDGGLECVGFGGDEKGIDLVITLVRQHLVGPRDFLDGIGDILLCFEKKNLIDLVGLDLGNLDKTGEDALRGDGASAGTTFPSQLRFHFSEHHLELSEPRTVRRGVGDQVRLGKARERDPTARRGLEDRHGDGLHAEVNGDGAIGLLHQTNEERFSKPCGITCRPGGS